MFAVTALVVATLDTINIAVHPMHPGFGIIADPLHYVVAIASAVLLPKLGSQGTVGQGALELKNIQMTNFCRIHEFNSG